MNQKDAKKGTDKELILELIQKGTDRILEEIN